MDQGQISDSSEVLLAQKSKNTSEYFTEFLPSACPCCTWFKRSLLPRSALMYQCPPVQETKRIIEREHRARQILPKHQCQITLSASPCIATQHRNADLAADVTFPISEKVELVSLSFQPLPVSGTGKSRKNTFKEHLGHVRHSHLALINKDKELCHQQIPNLGCMGMAVLHYTGKKHAFLSACQKLPKAVSFW